MSTGTQRSMSDGKTPRKASPDWIKSNTGFEGGNRKHSEGGENFVELKYRSLANIADGKMAKGIGIFSIALGLAEVLMPGQLAGLIGVSDRYRKFLPLLGAREIAHGIGIMSSAKPTTAVWTRVGGDVLDLAYLGAAFMSDDANKRRLTGATLAVLGVGILDLVCAQRLSSDEWSENDGNPMAPTTVGQPSARDTSYV